MVTRGARTAQTGILVPHRPRSALLAYFNTELSHAPAHSPNDYQLGLSQASSWRPEDLVLTHAWQGSSSLSHHCCRKMGVEPRLEIWHLGNTLMPAPKFSFQILGHHLCSLPKPRGNHPSPFLSLLPPLSCHALPLVNTESSEFPDCSPEEKQIHPSQQPIQAPKSALLLLHSLLPEMFGPKQRDRPTPALS